MKNYKFLVPVVLVVLLVLSIYRTYSSNISNLNLYNENLTAAREARELGVWTDAETYYKTAISYKPSVDVYVELGEMYIESDQQTKAKRWGETLCDAYPKDSRAYEYMIRTYILYKNYEECFRIYDEVCDLQLVSEEIETEMASVEYLYYSNGKYDDATVFSGGYCAIYSGEGWGYADTVGDEAIKCSYLYAGPFASEVAPVIDMDGEAYFIDSEGNKKIAVKNIDHIEMLGLIENGVFSLYDGKTWGFYNKDGELLFGGYEDASSIGNGLAAVKKDGYWSIVDSSGTVLTEDKYTDVLQDEKGIVYRNNRLFVGLGGNYYMIDSTGQKITSTAYENADIFHGDGYAAVQINGLWGFVDSDGSLAIDPQYEEAKSFSNGYAAVKVDGLWGFIDPENNFIIEPQFDGAKDFSTAGTVFVEENDAWRLLILYKYNH